MKKAMSLGFTLITPVSLRDAADPAPGRVHRSGLGIGLCELNEPFSQILGRGGIGRYGDRFLTLKGKLQILFRCSLDDSVRRGQLSILKSRAMRVSKVSLMELGNGIAIDCPHRMIISMS